MCVILNWNQLARGHVRQGQHAVGGAVGDAHGLAELNRDRLLRRRDERSAGNGGRRVVNVLLLERRVADREIVGIARRNRARGRRAALCISADARQTEVYHVATAGLGSARVSAGVYNYGPVDAWPAIGVIVAASRLDRR